MQVKFYYATQTGNAETLCDDLKHALPDGTSGEIIDLGDADAANLEKDALHVFVSATTGAGEVPDHGVDFWEGLVDNKPDLSHVRFAVFGLGDTSFDDTYNGGSQKLMEALLACKAKQVGERGLHDASSGEMPEDVGTPWLEKILSQAAA
ncbi:MAG: flavodoxin domain-containing protein [Pseudomonadota bacterium]